MGASVFGESPRDGPTRDEAVDRPTPPLRADVFVLGARTRRSTVLSKVPDELPVREFRDVEAYVEATSENLALALVSADLPDVRFERAVRETLSASRHARIALVASDGVDLLQCDVPRDDEFVISEEGDDLRTAIKHLYIRAYYSATLDRYYRVCLSIENHERAGAEADTDGRLEELYETRRRVRSYLIQFRQFLDPEDFTAIATREDRYADLVGSRGRAGNPSAAGLPSSCPDCGLDWTTWHNCRLEAGYERIGAKTYRCTGCGHTLADNDPDNYRVG